MRSRRAKKETWSVLFARLDCRASVDAELAVVVVSTRARTEGPGVLQEAAPLGWSCGPGGRGRGVGCEGDESNYSNVIPGQGKGREDCCHHVAFTTYQVNLPLGLLYS